MLRRLVVTAVLTVLLPAAATAQSINVSARAGTLGVGGELGLNLTSKLALRAGAGIIPIDLEATYSDLEYSVKPASPLLNAGFDFYPGLGGLRIGGGVLLVSKPTELEGTYTGTYQIGESTYTGTTQLFGEMDHGSAAPYVVIGTGHATGRGMGFFLDLGLGFLKEPALTLTASGDATQHPDFEENLERERAAAEQAAKDYLRVLPIFSIGFRFGL